MGKQLAITENSKHLIGKKLYITADGVFRKATKAYLTVNGVHLLCYKGGVDVAAMAISYSADGGMIDNGVVTMGDGKQYRLLTLTQSGTLTVPEEVDAEVWMCGGGVNGAAGGTLANSNSLGGAGAFASSGNVTLNDDMVAVVGSAGGTTQFGGIEATSGTNKNGGTGGGGALGAANGTGDGVTKYPFGDTSYFQYPHCAGGGGGWYRTSYGYHQAGDGGTNGGDGSGGVANAPSLGKGSASGGHYGGGNGGSLDGNFNTPANGSAATYYGSGGGGGSANYSWGGYNQSSGGAGYQGVIYIRIPV